MHGLSLPLNSRLSRNLDRRSLLLVSLRVLSAGGLAVDAYIHLTLASTYDAVRTSAVSQGDLFRAEGAVAILAAVAVLIRPRRYTAVAALTVAASGLAAVLTYRYYDVGQIGPLPAMYEPVWYGEKVRSAWSQVVASAAALTLLLVLQHRRK